MNIKKNFNYNIVIPIEELLEEHYSDKGKKKDYYINKVKGNLATLKTAFLHNQIETLDELLTYIPKNLVAKMLGYTYQSHFGAKSKTPMAFRIEEVRLLAEYLEVPGTIMYNIFTTTKNEHIKSNV